MGYVVIRNNGLVRGAIWLLSTMGNSQNLGLGLETMKGHVSRRFLATRFLFYNFYGR